jgi:SAM-dependent methyltransferase
MTAEAAEFFRAYALHRAEEGRGYSSAELASLPELRTGPLARQWAVRARSYAAFVRRVVEPMAVRGPLGILDLGAGNGWLCHRLARMGHKPVALDIRADDIDGLGAAGEFLRKEPHLFERISASFDALPFGARKFDITVFNASLHYATDLANTLFEAARVTRGGGVIVILDSPFYAQETDGEAMVAEKRTQGADKFGTRAGVLLAPRFIEFLTRERLGTAMPALIWSRYRVLYPIWYEMRPLLARLKSSRKPSRFDVWTARVS